MRPPPEPSAPPFLGATTPMTVRWTVGRTANRKHRYTDTLRQKEPCPKHFWNMRIACTWHATAKETTGHKEWIGFGFRIGIVVVVFVGMWMCMWIRGCSRHWHPRRGRKKQTKTTMSSQPLSHESGNYMQQMKHALGHAASSAAAAAWSKAKSQAQPGQGEGKKVGPNAKAKAKGKVLGMWSSCSKEQKPRQTRHVALDHTEWTASGTMSTVVEVSDRTQFLVQNVEN